LNTQETGGYGAQGVEYHLFVLIGVLDHLVSGCVVRHLRPPHLYGSAASRTPTPTKLSTSTATVTATPGSRTQGAPAIEWMFCASWSRTPQLTTGACSPRPRKDSDVSARIMNGTAKVREAMMWLVKEGNICRPMMRRVGQPSRRAAVTKSSCLSDRKRPRTTRARSVQPMSDRITVIAT